MCRLLQQLIGDALNKDYIKINVYRDGDFIVITTMHTDPSKEIYFEFTYHAVCAFGALLVCKQVMTYIEMGTMHYVSGAKWSL